MARLKRKYKIAIIAIISAVVILSFPPLCFFVLNSSQISYGTLHFDKNKELLFLNDTLLWDTGAFGSIIYGNNKDKIPNKTQIGYTLAFDTFHKIKLVKSYYSSRFNPMDSLSISKFCFITINLPKGKKYNNEIGLIGMNVISATNWLIDFHSEKIDILPQNKILEIKDKPKLTLKYKRKKIPKTQLDFSICQFKNVLIDAGYNGEITLLKSDIEIINEKYKIIDTLTIDSYGLYSAAPTIVNCYVYESIKINNIYFNNAQIIEGHKRMIGFKFFKRFDKVFLDTKEKEFRFY